MKWEGVQKGMIRFEVVPMQWVQIREGNLSRKGMSEFEEVQSEKCVRSGSGSEREIGGSRD